jgi:hypothetical protein
MSQFETLLEKEMERFQMGGFLIGDRVRFKKDALKLDYIAKRPQGFRDIIASCMDPTFDLNLRIGAIKSVYPSSATNFQAGNSAPDGVFIDIYIEYAPGLYRNPMTVPAEAVEIMDDGAERGPIPDSLRRPNNVHGPKEQKTAQDDVKADVNLTTKNVQMPGANKWDDTKPGGGNFKT